MLMRVFTDINRDLNQQYKGFIKNNNATIRITDTLNGCGFNFEATLQIDWLGGAFGQD